MALIHVLLLVCGIAPAAAAAADKTRIGWIERVGVSTAGLVMEAKVDTGADFSSVHADALRHFERDGRPWVEFTLRGQNGDETRLQREVLRTARIKKKDAGFQERPVILLQLCIGGSATTAPVNLAQRGHFKYPLLLGRNLLGGRYVVDPGEKYLAEPSCVLQPAEHSLSR